MQGRKVSKRRKEMCNKKIIIQLERVQGRK